MVSNAIGFGIIGCGMIARWHCKALIQIAENNPETPVRLVGVADRDYSRAKALAAELGIKAYADIGELLSDEHIHAVCICTPNGTHAEQALNALHAGKHVLVEKPLALNVADCDRLIQAAQERNLRAGVVSQMRFGGAVQVLHTLLEEEKLGRIVSAELSLRYYRDPDYYRNSAWHGTKSMDGGVLMNQGVHSIDLLVYLLGHVRCVWGMETTRIHEIQMEDTVAATLQFENGALGTVLATTAALPGYPRSIMLTGEKGSVGLTEDEITLWNVPGIEKPLVSSGLSHGAASPQGIPLQGHVDQLTDFVHAIYEDREPCVTLRDGRSAVSLIEAIHCSAQSGMAVNLSGREI